MKNTEHNQKFIVLSTILKPYNEVRIYERLGISLSETNKYQITITGTEPDKKNVNTGNIIFRTIGLQNRSFYSRFQKIINTYKVWRKVKPHLIIITTPELLLPVAIYKLFHNTKLVYDVQENYFMNIKYQRIYGGFKKLLILSYLKISEVLSKKITDHYLLAEECYKTELNLSKRRITVLENKTRPGQYERGKTEKTTLLFTGVLSEYSGIKTAIKVFEELHRQDPKLHLKIIGHAPSKSIQKYIHEKTRNSPNIEPIGVVNFQSHESIVTEILKADLGIVAQTVNEVSRNRIPTKLFEYSYFHLPYLVSQDAPWLKRSLTLGGAIPIDFNNPDAKSIHQLIRKVSFPESSSSAWKKESVLLNEAIDTLLK